MDITKIEQEQRRSKPANGDLSAELYAGIAMHGESKPAIDRDAVLAAWRRTWRVVLQDLTPLQRRALELEMEGTG